MPDTLSPEFLALLVPIFTDTCADSVRTMLVEQFVTTGISQGSAECVADKFMTGGLFEVIMNSMVGGADPTSDPEFTSQMMTAFTDCLTPEELANMGMTTP